MIAFQTLSIAHVVAGALLAPISVMFGLAAAPILVFGPLWMIVLGFRIWTPSAQAIAALRRTHRVSLAFAALLVTYGIFALRAAERSAASGGGLLGGFGLVPLSAGVVLGAVAVPSLVLAGRRLPSRRTSKTP
jgi:hypothetical protein